MIGSQRYKRVFSLVMITLLLSVSMFNSFGEESDLVTIEVDDTTVEMGSTVTLILTMDTSIDAEEIGVEGLENFEIESTSQSSTSSNINGVKTSSYQYTLILSPKSVGEFNLRAVVSGETRTYESQAILMSVSTRDTSLDSESEDVFIKTLVTGDDYYFGESIVIVYELYSRYNLNDFGFLDTVEYDGFIIESIPKDDLESNIVTINGDNYLKQIVKKDILVPTSTGSFEIPSYRFQANLSTGDFFSRSEPRYLSTDPVTLNVLELPTSNKPDEFSGLIGTLDVKFSLDKTEVAYGEALTLNVILSGTAGLETIGSLYEGDQNGFTIYETEKFTDKSLLDLNYIQSKEFEIIIVPDQLGELVLEAVELWYFDTDLNNYNKVEIPEQLISVIGDVSNNSNGDGSQANTEIVVINQVNYQDDSDDKITIEVNKSTLIIILTTILLLLIVIVAYRQLKSKPKNNKKKEYIKLLKASSSIYMVETLVENLLIDLTGLNLKSHDRKKLMACFESGESKKLLEVIILDIEKAKVTKTLELDKLKALVFDFIQVTIK